MRCSPTKQDSDIERPPRNTSPRGGKGAAQKLPGTAAPFNFPHSRSFRRAGAAVVRSSARLLLAGDERTLEATAAGKRDRAGLSAVRPRFKPAGSFLDPKSRQLPKLGGPRFQQGTPRPRAARPPPRPATRVRFPSPACRGFRRAGPGASGCEERARPCGTSPAPPRAQPDFLRRRVSGTPSPSTRDRPQSVSSWSV